MSRQDKTRDVDSAYAATRMKDARAYLQQAQVSLDYVEGTRRYATVVSAAAIAGIAATDVVCARTLGKVSAGAHNQAAKLLSTIYGSEKAGIDLSKLLGIKTGAQYAGKTVTERDAIEAIKRAQRLVMFAESHQRK